MARSLALNLHPKVADANSDDFVPPYGTSGDLCERADLQHLRIT